MNIKSKSEKIFSANDLSGGSGRAIVHRDAGKALTVLNRTGTLKSVGPYVENINNCASEDLPVGLSKVGNMQCTGQSYAGLTNNGK